MSERGSANALIRLGVIAAVLAVTMVTVFSALDRSDGPALAQTSGPYVSEPAIPAVFEGDLSTLPTIESPGAGVEQDTPIAGDASGGDSGLSAPEGGGSAKVSPTAPDVVTPPEFLTPNPNFDGIIDTGFNPPDTTGDVGANHYIQMVNAAFQIFDKAGNSLAGPSNINTLFTPLGGACAANNNGDPDVKYDPLADRWVLTQFVAFTDFCVAVSIGPNPVTSGWYLYDFNTGGIVNDYPKLAVWPDAYYMGSQRGYPGGSGDAWAFDRANMLNGNPATFQQFNEPNPGTMILPSHFEGPPPPAGDPAVFAKVIDGAEWGGADRLLLYEFHVDWGVPANSTWTALPAIATAPFDRNLCGLGLLVPCIPQPGTANLLQTISPWLMVRLQYRNFGTYETLVVNHSVDVDGADHAGVRWYELRKAPGVPGAWSIFQEATHSPDGGAPGLADDPHRWMGSIAMDGAGNIALGYSVSDAATTFPGIRYVGRLAGDPLDTLSHGEVVMQAGSAVQTTSTRWGDYSSMAVDPVDDCTFWYTQMYYAVNDIWRTRIGAFRFGTCDGVDLVLSKTADKTSALAGEDITYTIGVANVSGQTAENVVVTDVYSPASPGEGGVVGTCNDNLDNDGDLNFDESDTECAALYFIEDTDSCVEAPAGTLTCTLGDIPAGGLVNFQVKVHISAAFLRTSGGTLPISNTATVNSDDVDIDPSNNSATLATLVSESADLQLQKLSKPDDEVRAGESFDFEVIVNNLGPSAARNVLVDEHSLLQVLDSGKVTISSCALMIRSAGGTISVFSCTTGLLAGGLIDIGSFGASSILPTSPQDQGQIQIRFTLTATETLDINNIAEVSSDTPDPNTDNNVDEDGISVVDTADLAITKTDLPDPVAVGGLLTYTLTVTNNGPSTATNVVVQDVLLPGVTFVSATPSQGNCDAGVPVFFASLVTCNLGTIAAPPNPNTATVTLVVRVNDNVQAGTVLQNAAVVSSDEIDPDNSDNVARQETTVVAGANADLSIVKTDIPDPVYAGNQLFYDITVRNNGPAPATGVVVTDTLPAGVTYITDTGTCDTAALPLLTCYVTPGEGGTGVALVANCADAADNDGDGLTDLADPECAIQRDDSRTFTVKVRVNPDFLSSIPASAAPLMNTAFVAGNEPDPNLANNQSTAHTIVDDLADLLLTKECKPDEPLLVGSIATCTIIVDNLGPSDAQNVIVSDLHIGNAVFTVLSATFDPPPGSPCVIAGSPGTTVGITCDLGTEPAGGRTIITITLTSALPGDVNDVALVTSTTLDPNYDNNIDSDGVTFAEAADLKVTKLCKPDEPVPAGVPSQCTILVDNLGPSTANNVVLRDTHVSNGVFTITAATATPPGAACAPGITGGVVVCNLGAMLPGARVTVVVDLIANEPQDINDDADVTSDTFDPYLPNNQDQDHIQYVGSSDLQIQKTDDDPTLVPGAPNPGPDPVTVNGTLVYEIRVDNAGPSAAPNVVVEDVLPAGVSMISVAPSQGSCNAGVPGDPLQPLTCNLGTIAVGGFATISITVRVNPDVPHGTILFNQATVSSDNFDPNPGNNAVSVDTTVVGGDLSITKTDSPDPVTAGTNLTYTIVVTNNGAADALDVIVTDVLPAGVSIVSITVSGGPGTCVDGVPGDPLQPTVCTLNTIVAGGSRTITIVVFVDPSVPAGTILVNDACVSSSTSDPNLVNNCATAQTTVAASANLSIDKSSPSCAGGAGSECRIRAGETVQYRLVVTNNGPSTAIDVHVEDDFEESLPLGLPNIGLRIVGAPAFCQINNAGLNLSCELGDIPPTGFVTIVYDVRANLLVPPFDPFVTNVAVVSSPTPDPSLANNTDTHIAEIYDPLEGFPCIWRDPETFNAIGIDYTSGFGFVRFIGPGGLGFIDSGVLQAHIRTFPGAGGTVEILVSLKNFNLSVAGDGTCIPGVVEGGPARVAIYIYPLGPQVRINDPGP